MMTFPTPPTVMPSVGEGTGASPVQVPCAYPDGAAAKVASAPAAMARSHVRFVQDWSPMFVSSFGRSSKAVRENARVPMRGGTGEKPPGFELFTHEPFAVAVRES